MGGGELAVLWGERRVGVLGQRPHSGAMVFAYAESWLEDGAAAPISLSLPLRPGAVEGGAAHAFFTNLLPEGTLRTLLARRLGISADNDFALLRAIGGECAGALSVVPDDDDGPAAATGYRQLRPEELARLADADAGALPELLGEGRLRLSLAGAQDKLPVLLRADQTLWVPRGSEPTTHILKLPNPHFHGLAINEAFCLALARAVGLPAATAELRPCGAQYVTLVERYDRVQTEPDGPVTRLHQEDLCQALGLAPTRKYEQEGGPSFARCFELVRDHSVDPLADTRALLRWQLFNLLCGNADGHAKNLSLLHAPPRGPRLAPFYDLVCTRVYPRLDRHLALALGGGRDPGQIGAAQWARLAQELGLGRGYVKREVEALCSALPPASERIAAGMAGSVGDAPVLQLVLHLIKKQARHTAQLLGQ